MTEAQERAAALRITKLWKVVLLVAAAAGVIAIPVQLQVGAAAAERNTRLLQQLQRAEQQRGRDAAEHQQRNEQLHACIVELIFDIVTSSPEERRALGNPCPPPTGG